MGQFLRSPVLVPSVLSIATSSGGPLEDAAIEDGHVASSSMLRDLTFLGVVGIQNAVRTGVLSRFKKPSKLAWSIARSPTTTQPWLAPSLASAAFSLKVKSSWGALPQLRLLAR